ncbi:MAG: serpin family protein [Candidatus Eisenbacteria bacterium]
MRRIGITIGVLVLLASPSLATDKSRQWTSREIPADSKAEVRKVVSAANDLAIDLYGALAAKEGNLFFSPTSVSASLAMTYAGAAGATRDEMAGVLGFPLEDPKFDASYGMLLRSLSGANDAGFYELRMANRLWGRKGTAFLAPFLKITGESYGAPIQAVDLAGDPEGSRKAINAWIGERTNGRIPEAVKSLSPAARLVLTNAIYFHGSWKDPFKEDDTRDLPFHVTAADSIDVPMMHRQGTYPYGKEEGVRVLELPYAGEDLNMVVVLPDEKDGLGAIEGTLDKEKLRAWLRCAGDAEVDVYLPRFRMTDEFDLAPVLAGMGMPSLFKRGDADLSGMTADTDLFVSNVFHSSFVDVNEKGTEAAAATGVVVALELVERSAPPVFRADHPFLFFIRDKWTGAILFMGRVADPLAG